MIAPKQLETLAHKLCSVLPESMRNLEQDMQQTFKDILLATFSRMDLVTRDEFDIQTNVLAKTREKVEALQAQIDMLLSQEEN